MPQKEWLAQFDEKVPDASKELRSEIAALLGEFQELRRRRGAALTPEDPTYRARRDGIVDRFDERYSGRNPLTPEQIEERRKFIGIVGIKVSFAPDGAKNPLLVDVVPSLPADHSGIEAGDELLAINGQDVAELTSQEIGSRLFGAPGEKVTLRVRRSVTGEETVHELERVDSDEVLPGNNVVR